MNPRHAADVADALDTIARTLRSEEWGPAANLVEQGATTIRALLADLGDES